MLISDNMRKPTVGNWWGFPEEAGQEDLPLLKIRPGMSSRQLAVTLGRVGFGCERAFFIPDPA